MASRTPTRRGAKGRKRVSTRNKKKTAPPSLLARVRLRIRTRFGDQADDIWGVGVLVLAALVGLAYMGEAGPVGDGLVSALGVLFGLWGYFIPLLLAVIGGALIVAKPRQDYARMAIGLALN